MPNVGPMLAWRIAIVAVRPMCRNAIPSPIVVVVLPSPSGAGVIAVTTTYLAFGRSCSSSIALNQPGRDADAGPSDGITAGDCGFALTLV
jgi:hypothetical protein